MAVLQHPDAAAKNMKSKARQPNEKRYRGVDHRSTNGVPSAAYSGDTAAVVKNAQAGPSPGTQPAKVDEEEDDEVAPTPVNFVINAYREYEDGRKELIRGTIPGLEHLRHQSNVVPTYTRAPDCLLPPTNVRSAQTSQTLQRAQSLTLPSRRVAVAKGVRRRAAVKKPRAASNARGVKRSQPSGSGHGSDGDEDDGDDNNIRHETTKSFCMGDMAGLKDFIGHRIDELTMKPVRGMVTSWIKQLQPRRQGEFGPYHRQKPQDMPADATPPWWPADVEYTEPAHLDKDGLVKLAIEVIIQHRNLPVDEVKRACPGGWIAKLRSMTQFTIDTTPEDQFSSSKNVVFSRLMKERAVDQILPNLFEFAQSYEDYVFQHSLWEYADANMPLGPTKTWHFIPRPPKQITVRRRDCTTFRRRTRAPQEETNIDASKATSNSDAEAGDTEVDEGMELHADRLHEEVTARAARKDRPAVTRPSIMKVSSPVEIAAALPTPVAVVTASPAPTAMTIDTPTSPPDLISSGNELSPNSSFNSSVGSLQLEEAKEREVTAVSENMQTNLAGFPYQQAPCFAQMQPANVFGESVPATSLSFDMPGYMDLGQYPLFDESYGFSMGAHIATSNDMGFQYAGGNMMQPPLRHMPEYMAHASPATFDGLPCDIGPDDFLPQQSQGGPYLSRPNENPFTNYHGTYAAMSPR